MPVAVRGHVQKCRESRPFDSRVDMIAFDVADELPSGMVGGFKPIARQVAATVNCVTAEIDVVAIARAT